MIATVQLILRVWDLIQTLIGVYKAKDAANWDKLIQADLTNYLALKTAKTPQEVQDAQSKIASGWFNS